MEIVARSVQEAFGAVWNELEAREPIPSRNGACKELVGVQIKVTNPANCLFHNDKRKDFYLAKLYEALWVMTGCDSIEHLVKFIPRAKDYSDDGLTWRGAYGPRLRDYGVSGFNVDQVKFCINLLKKDPDTRRAVISIYDPSIDSTNEGKDKPCNNFIQFLLRNNKLHMLVYQRSCDLLWGWTGINAYEWYFLQSLVLSELSPETTLGDYIHTFGSLHVYKEMQINSKTVDVWKRCKDIVTSGYNLDGNSYSGFEKLEELPIEIAHWYDLDDLNIIREQMEQLATIAIGEGSSENKMTEMEKILSKVELSSLANVLVSGFALWCADKRQPYTYELAKEIAYHDRL